jgi:glycosyltransferase involved in cell wall biosynthesis
MDITIVIPTLNRMALLKRALDSALGQTLPCKVLVSDNGSSDGTKGYLADREHPLLTKKRRDVTVTHQEHATLLQGWVDTEWAVFLSDDDWLEPGFIEAINQAHLSHPGARMIYSQSHIWMWNQSYLGAKGPEVEPGDQFLLHFLRGQREPCWCAMALRIEDIRAIGPQPSDRSIGDMYYWVRVAGKGEVASVGRPLSNYCYIRDSPDNATSGTALPEWIRESSILASEMVERILLAGRPEPPTPKDLEAMAKGFLARTGSNHVLWNRLRGRAIILVGKEVSFEWRRFIRQPKIWIRIFIGLVAPKRVIKFILLIFVRIRALN